MRKVFLVFLVCFACFNFGCDDSVDIIMEYDEQIAAFLVLDSRYDKQILKVQKLQNSFGLPSAEKLIDPISARLTLPAGYHVTFKDTIMNTVPNFNTLYIDSIDLEPGVYQLLVVAKDSLSVWSNIVVQNKLDLNVASRGDSAYTVEIKTSHVIYTHIKPFLVYSVRQNAGLVEKSIEIPGGIDINNRDTVETFGKILEIPVSVASPYRLRVLFSNIEYTKNKLKNYFGAENIQFNRMKFVTYTYSANLYQYVNSYEGYTDDYSVRLDQPNYTNIVGGTGIFGAVLIDSTFYNLY